MILFKVEKYKDEKTKEKPPKINIRSTTRRKKDDGEDYHYKATTTLNGR